MVLVNVLARGLPKVGDHIPIEKFYVSKCNVNVDEPFGESQEDGKLIANLRAGKKIVQPFTARPEDKEGRWKLGMDLNLAVGFGVYEGRRRFLGGKEVGFKEFTVGEDCLIREVSDEEAEEASWTENFKEFRKGMNPITRAKRLNRFVTRTPGGIRGYSRRSGIPASSITEFLTVLKLSQRMQNAVARGLLTFTDGLKLARMKLGKDLQDKLAEVLETQGLEAFKKEMARLSAGGRPRGVPPGVYYIVRAVFDKRYAPDVEIIKKLDKLAEAKGIDRDKCAKWIIEERVKSVV